MFVASITSLIRCRGGSLRTSWAFILLALSACGAKAPACGDESTVSLVRQVFIDSLKQNRGLLAGVTGWESIFEKPGAVSLQSIRTTVDNAGKGNVCDATLAVKIPEKSREVLESPAMKMILGQDAQTEDIKMSGGTASIAVQYTTSLTDDRKQQVVEVVGHQALSDWLWGMGVAGAFGVEATSPSNTQPKTSAVEAPMPPVASVEPQQVASIPATAAQTTAPNPAAKPQATDPKEEGGDGSARIKLLNLECNVSCHLEFIGPGGKRETALCSQAELCKQWESHSRDFNRDRNKTAQAQMASSVLGDGREIVDLILE